jgi:hypothetical protein
VLAILLGPSHHVFAGDHTTSPSVFGLRIVADAGDVNGTALLIRREERATDATLSFLTSSRLSFPQPANVMIAAIEHLR